MTDNRNEDNAPLREARTEQLTLEVTEMPTPSNEENRNEQGVQDFQATREEVTLQIQAPMDPYVTRMIINAKTEDNPKVEERNYNP